MKLTGKRLDELHRYMVYLAPNEIKFSHSIDGIKDFFKGEPFSYFGIVGGVDTNLNYISALEPERTILIDKNPYAITYAKDRLRHIAKLDPAASKFEFLSTLGYEIRKGDLFKDEIFKRAPKKLREYFEKMSADKKTAEILWLNRIGALQQQIPSFKFYERNFFQDDLTSLIKPNENLVIYASNIVEWVSKQRDTVLIDSLERNFDDGRVGVVIHSRFEKNKILAYLSK